MMPGQIIKSQSTGTNTARAGAREQPSALPSGRASSAGLDTLPRGSQASDVRMPDTLGRASSDTLTPAQQREMERESAFKASTGSGGQTLLGTRGSASTLGTAADRGAATSQPWGALASQNKGKTAGSTSSKTAGGVGTGNSANSQQQSLGDGESEADIGDYDPRGNFGLGSSSTSTSVTGQGTRPDLAASDALGRDSRSFGTGSSSSTSGGGFGTKSGLGASEEEEQAIRHSGFGTTSGNGLNARARPGASLGDEDEEGDSSNFMLGRDPTDPSSVVGAQQGFTGQPHTVQQRNTAINTAGTGLYFTHNTSVYIHLVPLACPVNCPQVFLS